ncbi:hypothetical protein P9B03_09075 [Metasolibacillus meyeri]|uniref:Uncharacterized protein n=1 Tax=Metasolibacillus meyeri TaxID=1071052 RepID=A0AAW9NRS3_9BACL|nr:hypothetical protein [Metasolibacillus meyeri]MEC1178633.1 hypothetical protein [Metasolibacillus meyeri]
MLYGYDSELITMLAKTYIKYGLNTDEFIVLNATIVLSTYEERLNVLEIGKSTNKSANEVEEILNSLLDRGKIKSIDGKVDRTALYQELNSIIRSEMTLPDLIMESMENLRRVGYEQGCGHLGQVELIPFDINNENQGIAVKGQSDYWSEAKMWSKERMIELANYILKFTESIDNQWINHYNARIYEQREKQREIDKMKEEERKEQKKKRSIPKNGYIVLFRLPDGMYKFAYTTSLLLEQKIISIQKEHGDNIQIIHTLETYDTKKFYHKFIKTQFSNRVKGGKYELNEEDVIYIKNEKFPSNAMEWFEG